MFRTASMLRPAAASCGAAPSIRKPASRKGANRQQQAISVKSRQEPRWSPIRDGGNTSWGSRTRRDLAPALRVIPETSQVETKRGEADINDAEPWQWEKSEDAAWAYGAWASVILLGSIPLAKEVENFDLFYFLAIAMSTIYIGAHRNMTAKARQSVTMKEGFLAPLLASGVLFGGYLLFKLFPDLSIQTVLNGYFALVGTVAVAGNLQWPLRQWTGQDSLGAESIKCDLPEGLLLDMAGDPIDELRIAPSDLIAVAIAIGLTYEDISHAHMLFPVNNAIATMIVADLLGLLGLNSFRTAAVLLFGLLAYDVFWVFGSPKVVGDNVMLSMATSDHLTGPIKLLFPRSEAASFQEGGEYPFELLGLGDVALPGLLACLSLRYDASRTIDIRGRAEACAKAMQDALENMSPDATGDEICDAAADAIDGAYDEIFDKEQQMQQEGLSSSERVSEAVLGNRNFFWPVLGAYGLGLYIAFDVNRITHLGQPALLYLVPCTLGAVALTAAVRGEMRRVWQFKDKGSGMTLKEAWEATAPQNDADSKAED